MKFLLSPFAIHNAIFLCWYNALFLTDKGYQNALATQEKGHIKILSHAKVVRGDLIYDRKDQVR